MLTLFIAYCVIGIAVNVVLYCYVDRAPEMRVFDLLFLCLFAPIWPFFVVLEIADVVIWRRKC